MPKKKNKTKNKRTGRVIVVKVKNDEDLKTLCIFAWRSVCIHNTTFQQNTKSLKSFLFSPIDERSRDDQPYKSKHTPDIQQRILLT